jgi:acyl transferase domain-containing protein/acyl carrier protein
MKRQYTGFEVAIIGMSCRVSGASNWREYWENLKNGKETLKTLSDDDLLKLNADKRLIGNKSFVKTISDIRKKDCFDSTFFDYTQDEAKLMDPQNRLFHECVWEALEDAGYNPEQIDGLVGIYTGASDNLNWRVYSGLMNHNSIIPDFVLKHINNKDFMATLVSYKLNLKGPSIGTQTACSSSLVAIHTACKALIFGETKMAIAGGVSIASNIQTGYFYEEGSILSKDGHCKTFDKNSSGTVGGEGLGTVVLKRLADAINDGDHIYAIIKGSAANNDGKRKVGYTAPSIEGQVECIKMAQRFAKVEPETIGYVEAHGTATKLGDSIEVEALNISFKKNKNKISSIGSVKTNIGHLDAAAGVAGLIKAALSLKEKQIPASLHYLEADSEIDFNGGPFYVNTDLRKWERNNTEPLRAAVNSFGVGGTNAHIILEEAPEQEQGDEGQNYKLLSLSAKTEGALLRYANDLKNFLSVESGLNVADMCYTLQVGRKHFGHRRSLAFKNKEELIGLLEEELIKKQIIKFRNKDNSMVFMFSGQGSQYINMGKDLYKTNKLFQDQMNTGFSILEKCTGKNFKNIVFPETDTDTKINQTCYTQPVIFLFEYALAQVLISYGLTPQCMIGHSIGEYVAACISGVFSFEDALKLVVKRGELMNALPAGTMISIPVTEKDAQQYLSKDVSLAAVNGPSQVVLSGDIVPIEKLMMLLTQMQIPFVKLHTSHAFHSVMQDPIMDAFKSELEKVNFNKPKLPFISNLSGTFIKDEEAMSAKYWVSHLRQTVRFSDGIKTALAQNKDSVFIEIGAGHSLSSLLKQQLTDKIKPATINLIPSVKDSQNSELYFIENLGKLWAYGLKIDWKNYYKSEKRKRISLPTYSFEPLKYPTEVDAYSLLHGLNGSIGKREDKINNWFYRTFWKPSIWLPSNNENKLQQTALIFSDNFGLGNELEKKLYLSGIKYVSVHIANNFQKQEETQYGLDPKEEKDYEKLFTDLKENNIIISSIYHLWNYENENPKPAIEFYQVIGYESLLKIVKAYSLVFSSDVMQLNVICNKLYQVFKNEIIDPIKSTSLGVVKVIPLEFQNISCRAIDINEVSPDSISSLWTELQYVTANTEIAIRGKNRYVKDLEKIDFDLPSDNSVIKTNKTYLITGANGAMGRLFAGFLAKNFKSNLILISRSEKDTDLISALEKHGSKIAYIQADVSQNDKINNAIADAEVKLGNVNGVIHAAGLGDFAGMVLRRTKTDDDEIFKPKVFGTQVLNSIFETKELDFFINCSSQNVSLANIGQVAYVAANNYLDAVAESGNINYPVISIEWDVLKDAGMAVNALNHLTISEKENLFRDFIDSEEAIKVLQAALYLKIPVQVISTRDLKYLMLKQKEIKDEILNTAFNSESMTKVERPDLSTNFVSPKTETEIKVKSLFEDLFGLQEVGIEDDFFELGGDSLKAMVIIRRISKEFNEEVSFKEFLEAKNVSGISKVLDEKLWINKEVETTNEIII